MSEQDKGGETSDKGDLKVPSIDREIRLFIQQIEGLSTALPFVTLTLAALRHTANSTFNTFLRTHGTAVESSEGEAYTLPPDCTDEASKLKRNYENLQVGLPILHRQFIVSLVSQYDAFLGRLLRCLFYLQPGLLNSTELNLSFEQLMELSSIENARDYLVEKEVEKVLRMSHSEQFAWLGSKFKLQLKSDLASWPTFIEVTERRNLFVHCDGVVSRQYLTVCEQQGAKFTSGIPKLGERLHAGGTYFQTAFECIFEIAVKLSQVLWRKISKDLEAADRSLIDITFDLICAEQYGLALTLLEFGTEVLKKHASEANCRTLIINQAQTYKWIGKTERCKQLLVAEDWTACGISFQLAVAVLSGDFTSAALYMRSIGPNGDVEEAHYKSWPLFQEFRKSKEFIKAFEEVFGKPFTQVVTASVVEEKDSSPLEPQTLQAAMKAEEIISESLGVTSKE